MGKDYYQILGISPHGTREDIANSFRKLAIKYHPQRDDQDLANKTYAFSEICEAYHVLSNSETKQLYDQYGEEILKEGAPTAQGGLKGGYSYHGNSLEVFRQFFGTPNPYCEITLPVVKDEVKETEGYLVDHSEVIERDIVITLKCTLLEFFYGCTKEIIYTRDELYKEGKNSKKVDIRKEIHVQPGFDHNTILRFPGKGDMKFGEDTSALVIKFEQEADQNIQRKGNDLIQIHTITLQDALQASSVSLETLTGDRVELSIGKSLPLPPP